jgi:hypothetical protein
MGSGSRSKNQNPIPVLEGLVLQLVETGGERWPKLWMWFYMLLSNAAMGCLQMGFHIKVLIAKMTTKRNFIFLFWKISQFYKKKGKFWIFLSSVNFTIFSIFFGELRQILDIWKLKKINPDQDVVTHFIIGDDHKCTKDPTQGLWG